VPKRYYRNHPEHTMNPMTTAPPAAPPAASITQETRGMLLGLAGVAVFSLTLPLTRLAVRELDPLFVALARALGAALLAALWLGWKRAPLPGRAAWRPLALVGLGCVIGFPLLTSIALQSLPASHGAVLGGILPLSTALYAALRGYETPSRGFWFAALCGSSLVVAFALLQGGGSLHAGDALMLGAVALGAAGYAEGGRLARTMGGPEVISWALVLSAPVAAVMLAVGDAGQFARLGGVHLASWLALGYVTAFSMFIGFFFWYRGLALGGVARVGQVQLLQPFLSLTAATLLLGEHLSAATWGFALAVIATVALGRRTGVRRPAIPGAAR
jgi:drug/metabolite transporter (DMT)-like permease